jgi:hypothetical protein
MLGARGEECSGGLRGNDRGMKYAENCFYGAEKHIIEALDPIVKFWR